MDLLTISEVAKKVKVNEATVRGWLNTGSLTVIDLGPKEGYRINSEDLEDFLARQKTQGALREVTELQIQKESTGCLCSWLRSENQALANFYRENEQVYLKIGEKVKGSLEIAVKSGDPARGKAYNDAMALIYKRWNKTRKDYQKWLLSHESRWEAAREAPLVPEAGQEPQELSLKNKKEELKALFVTQTRSQEEHGPDYYNQLQKESRYNQQVFDWLRKEQEELKAHYLKMEKHLKRIAHDLKAEAKKAAKQMDFVKGQVFNDALVNLYLEWERPKQNYNQWLMEQEVRWQKFKSDIRG